MSVVYAVLCHSSPRYVADLVRALYHPEQAILLHADAKAPISLHEAVHDLAALLPNVHVVDSVLCSWGGWSLVEATLRLMGAALTLPTDWRHFCVLSEHHMPLQPPATIAKLLPEGLSFSDASLLPAMDLDHRNDLGHRFLRHWRELPGVGPFALGPRHLSLAQLERFRLGSQWVVLAREACERLWSVRNEAAVWAPFRDSLVPDETALMSVLRGTNVGVGLNVRRENPTFLAMPDASGGFADDDVRVARARGHLFIRKRPARLPPFASALLASFPGRPNVPMFPAAPAATEDPRVRGLASRLRSVGAVSVASPGLGPLCCLEISVPGQAPSLSVHVVSHDFCTFKLLLAWRRNFDGVLAPMWLGGHETTLIGARLPGLVLAREVHLPDVPDNGFVGSEELVRHVGTAVAVARRLSDLVASFATAPRMALPG